MKLPYWKPVERIPFMEKLEAKNRPWYARLLLGGKHWAIVLLRDD